MLMSDEEQKNQSDLMRTIRHFPEFVERFNHFSKQAGVGIYFRTKFHEEILAMKDAIGQSRGVWLAGVRNKVDIFANGNFGSSGRIHVTGIRTVIDIMRAIKDGADCVTLLKATQCGATTSIGFFSFLASYYFRYQNGVKSDVICTSLSPSDCAVEGHTVRSIDRTETLYGHLEFESGSHNNILTLNSLNSLSPTKTMLRNPYYFYDFLSRLATEKTTVLYCLNCWKKALKRSDLTDMV